MTERAPFSADPARSRGRQFAEPASPTRSEFQRDRDRIIHSTAFRRLAHKTQVFVHHEGDHFRTRLTHTIEVAQIARALARGLALDEDLAEAVALGHDLGHTPFGHTGEDALDACMIDHGGFDHNAHGLRLVTELEHRYADFDGLNLTRETLEGLVKHNGPLLQADGAPMPRYAARGVAEAILSCDRRLDLRLAQYPGLEAQAAAIADDIAYNAHDIDDGLRAGLFTLADLRPLAFPRELLDEIGAKHPGLESPRVIHELVRRLITRAIEDVFAHSRAQLAAASIVNADDVARAGRMLIGFSRSFAGADAEIKAFLFANMYRHPQVTRVREQADALVRRLFAALTADPDAMPDDWRLRAKQHGPARAAADYIAGMTDRFALNEARRLFDDAPDLR